MLIAYEDLERPVESMMMLAVKNGMKGFSLGRLEKKMGQKCCPTSELVFEDCFIPDENVCVTSEDVKGLKGSVKEANMQLIDLVVTLTRPWVGAISAGVTRAAYEEAVNFASETEVDGRLLVNHEWAQCMLAEMYKNVALARMSYMESSYVNMQTGLMKYLMVKPAYFAMKYSPYYPIFDRMMDPFVNREITTKMARRFIMTSQKDWDAKSGSGWASLAKFAASELGLKNCQLALDMMGQAGVRQDHRAEKLLRDSRLLQIYEGTNQLNRLNVFK